MYRFKLMQIRKLFLLPCFIISFWISKAQDKNFESIAAAVDEVSKLHDDQAKVMIHKLYKIAFTHPDSLQLIPRYIYHKSYHIFSQGIQDSALVIKIKSFLNRNEKKIHASPKGLLYYSLSLNYLAQGNYAEAFSSALQSLQIFKKQKDTLFMAKSLNLLGISCYSVNLLSTGYDYFYRARSFLSKKQPDYYNVTENIYRNYFIEGNLGRCKDSLTGILPLLTARNDTALLIATYSNLASCCLEMGDTEASFRYCQQTRELKKRIDNKRFTAVMYQNFAFYYYYSKDFPKAVEYFKQSIVFCENHNITPYLIEAYDYISDVYRGMGNIDSAYVYLQKYREATVLRGTGTKAIAAYHQYISAILESSENKLVIAEQEIVLKNRWIMLVVILSTLSIVTIALILSILQSKRRLKDIENKKLSEQLVHEKKIQELQKEKHNEAIASKIREITSYSLQLSNKNSLLKDIYDLSKQLSVKGTDTEGINQKIISIVQGNLNNDHEWESFKIHFEKVHPSFFDKLKTCCNELTENNLKVCAYFRIGMSSKQIAQILNISSESVSMNRYRLRKKLGLSEDANLEDYLRSI